MTNDVTFRLKKPEAGTEYQTHPAPPSSTSFSHRPNSHNSHSSEFKVVLTVSLKWLELLHPVSPLTTIPSVKLTINLPQLQSTTLHAVATTALVVVFLRWLWDTAAAERSGRGFADAREKQTTDLLPAR